MASFAYRILPPRAELWDTIGSEEVAALVRYLEHLERLTQRASSSVLPSDTQPGKSGKLMPQPSPSVWRKAT